MEKILIVFNHLQIADGVTRTAISLSEELIKLPDVSVTLCPLFKFNKEVLDFINPKIQVKPIFKFHFKGLTKLLRLIPSKFLYSFLIKEKYDIEIGYGAYLPVKLVASSTNKHSKKYIWLHNYNEAMATKKEFSGVDKIVCVSKYIHDRIKEELAVENNIEYVHNLVDSNTLIKLGSEPIEEQLILPLDSKFVFVTVGKLRPAKGIDRLINCAHRLKNDGFNFEIWIVGDGPERKKLEDLVLSLGLQGYVNFLGIKSNPHAYTSKADLFVCSSYYEGYSTVCTEALILGVPFISTDVSGAKEMVEEAECGLVVSNENDEELYLALKNVLENPSVVVDWKKTLSKTKNRFSKENRVEKMLRVLELKN